MKPHLDAATHFWKQVVKKGNLVVDATCGNGHDSLKLAQLSLSKDQGSLICMDIQNEAILETKKLLKKELLPELLSKVSFHLQCHSTFPQMPASPSCIIYNLGYLPKSDKTVITQADTTLKSIEKGLQWLQVGGGMTLTVYTGHPGGLNEQEALIEYCTQLDPRKYQVSHTEWINKRYHPSLITLLKIY